MKNNRTEYQYKGDWFVIEKWKQLGEFIPDADETNLATLHEAGLEHGQFWNVARRLFGINPVILTGTGYDAERMEPTTLRKLADEMSKEVSELKIMLDGLALAFVKKLEEKRIAGVQAMLATPIPEPEPQLILKAPAPQPAAQTVGTPPSAPPVPPMAATMHAGDLTPDEVNTLIAFGFDFSMFEMDSNRPTPVRNVEARWFVQRLLELERLFLEPLVKSLARQAIVNELLLRRVDADLLRTPAVTERFWQLQEKKVTLEETYASQWEQIEGMCPQFKTAKNRAAIIGLLSDFIAAYKEFHSKGTNKVADGIFTALEIQVELRTSKQAEDAFADELGSGVRYRLGWVAAINEAKQGTFDPKFRRSMPNSLLKVLDEGMRQGIAAAMVKLGLPIVDLMDQSEAGEYTPLFIPSDANLPPADEAPKHSTQTVPSDVVEPIVNVDLK